MTKDYWPKWRKANRERCLATNKKYRDSHKEKMHACCKNWKKKHPLSVQSRLHVSIASRIWFTLKNNKKRRTWESLVGYALSDLVKHLEGRFDNKMNWRNYGSYWHVDHIKPLSWFKSDQFKECWALENLQPLERIKNLSKRNYYIG
jgi:hypothetical protein